VRATLLDLQLRTTPFGNYQLQHACGHLTNISQVTLHTFSVESDFTAFMRQLKCELCFRHAESFLFDGYLQ
jgi:hypothetical protein